MALGVCTTVAAIASADTMSAVAHLQGDVLPKFATRARVPLTIREHVLVVGYVAIHWPVRPDRDAHIHARLLVYVSCSHQSECQGL